MLVLPSGLLHPPGDTGAKHQELGGHEGSKEACEGHQCHPGKGKESVPSPSSGASSAKWEQPMSRV